MLVRAIVLLEHIGSPDAIEILKAMSPGHPQAQPTRTAVEAFGLGCRGPVSVSARSAVLASPGFCRSNKIYSQYPGGQGPKLSFKTRCSQADLGNESRAVFYFWATFDSPSTGSQSDFG
jgi:hypothetical protein